MGKIAKWINFGEMVKRDEMAKNGEMTKFVN